MADSQDRFFDQLSVFLQQQQAGVTDFGLQQQIQSPGQPGSLEEIAAMLQAPRLREVRFQNNQLEYFDGTGWVAVGGTTGPTVPKVAGIRFPLSFRIKF